MRMRTRNIIKNYELRIMNFVGESLPLGCTSLQPTPDLHPKKVTHKKSTGAKKVTFLEEKNGKRKCTSRSKNQSNN